MNLVGAAPAGFRYGAATQNKLRCRSQCSRGNCMAVPAGIAPYCDKQRMLEFRAVIHGEDGVQIPGARPTEPVVKLTAGEAIAGHGGGHVSQSFMILKHENKSRTNGFDCQGTTVESGI